MSEPLKVSGGQAGLSELTGRVDLLTPRQVHEICTRLGIRPTKKLGQNFVLDAGTVRKIVSEARVEAGDAVLEIGPGLGSLTLGLLEAGCEVYAVELDNKLARYLSATVAGCISNADEEWEEGERLRTRVQVDGETRLRLVHRDALELVPEDLQGFAPELLVSNLPYNVAVPVILRCLEQFPSLKRVLVMVQKEVGLRLAARAGEKIYGVPSAKLAWYGSARVAAPISRTVFYPVPNVDSVLVRIDVEPKYADAKLREEVFALIDQAFSARRKMLRGQLKNWAEPADITELLEECAISPTARAENLEIGEFVALARARRSRVGGDGADLTARGEAAAPAACPQRVLEASGGKKREAHASAPGKINLFLAASGPGGDGYHRLNTLFQGLNLCERVHVALTAPGELSCHTRLCPPGENAYGYSAERDRAALSGLPIEDNLAVRAVRLLASHIGYTGGFALEIEKSVPVAAGMAGGSADAAAALLASRALLCPDLPQRELARLAAQIGADVPFGLYGSLCLGTARGDEITSLPAPAPRYWTLAVSPELLPTPRVFARFDARGEGGELPRAEINPAWWMTPPSLVSAAPKGAAPDEFWQAFTRPEPFFSSALATVPPALIPLNELVKACYEVDPTPQAQLLKNDLEPAALDLVPALDRSRRFALEHGALACLVSGSGPTLAALCASAEESRELAALWARQPEVAYTLALTNQK